MSEEQKNNQKRIFIKDLEKLLKTWGINCVIELWLSADDMYLVMRYSDKKERAIYLHNSNSFTQIIKDIVCQGGLNN